MKKRDEILGILLPDQHNTYLLPNVSIAEIFTLDNETIQALSLQLTHQDQHRTIRWRQTDLTLFHLNQLLSNEYTIQNIHSIEKPRIAVINPVTKPGLPLYAILTTNTPRLTRLKFSDLTQYTQFSTNEAIAYVVNIHQDQVYIPNLIHIENQVRSRLEA